MTKPHFAGLDGLRGVAALAVVYMHEVGIFLPGIGPVVHAELAVDLFFLLSGFVLAYAYDRRLDGGQSWGAFMQARLIRLYPMLAAGLALGAAVSFLKAVAQHAAIPGEAPATLLPALLLVPTGIFYDQPGPFSSTVDLYPFDFPAWSLLFELIASALFGTRLRRLAGWPVIVAFAVCSLLLAVATVAAGHIGLLGFQGYLGIPAGLLRVLVPFTIGVVLFRTRIYERLPQLPFWSIAVIAAVLLTLPIENQPWIDLGCVFVVFPILVSFTARARRSESSDRICAVLGRLSYPVYLLHIPVSRMAGFALKAVLPSASPAVLIVTAAAASIAASFAAVAWYDEPLRGALTRWTSRRNAPPVDA